MDTAEPSSFARGILASQPYTFLDDAPLEERRTQAVLSRRVLDVKSADEIGALDPEAIERVREEAWPQPANAEEVHEALLWMGYVTEQEAEPWRPWLDELSSARRVEREGDRWFAVEATREPKAVLKGRMEALGPILAAGDDPLLLQLESEGVVLRTRIGGRQAWCDRRLLARIQRYTLDRLRREIEPVSAAQLLRFLACWQHVDPGAQARGAARRGAGRRAAGRLRGSRRGLGGERPAGARARLPARVARPADAFGRGRVGPALGRRRLRGARARRSASSSARTWTTGPSLSAQTAVPQPSGTALQVVEVLASRGAMFFQELSRATKLPPAFLEAGLSELVALGRVTCDSFGGLRWLIVPASKRREGGVGAGRWSLLPREALRLSPGRGKG